VEQRAPKLSVVIPAHNEEAVLARCLDALLADAAPGDIEVVVAANGCTDRTVEIARRYRPAVTVVEVAEASKHAALNAGDTAATTFPRAYLDADIELAASALWSAAKAMEGQAALVGAPAPEIDLTGCPATVRSFYRVWCALPWFRDNPVGSGVYLLSEEGHRRLGAFPDITNDDQYVHDLFTAEERACDRTHRFVVRPPRTVAGLILRRTRTLRGQRELSARFGTLPGTSPRASWRELLRWQPRLVLDLPIFVTVTKLAARAAGDDVHAGGRWERDETSRSGGERVAGPSGGRSMPTKLAKVRNSVQSFTDVKVWAHGLRILHFYGYSHVRELRKLTMGANPTFAPNVSLNNAERITIGDRPHIGERVCLWAGDSAGRISIGDDVLIGPGSFVTASNYGIVEGTPPPFQDKVERDVVIGDGAWIGANCTILAGVTIGPGAIVAAGSAVSKDLPANMICGGVPAKPLKPRPQPGGGA
jgi:acetyltransferase-like isoleucine patch superfamily enzyme